MNQIISASGKTDTSAANLLNKRLAYIGPNWQVASLELAIVPSAKGKIASVVLAAVVKLTTQGNTKDWPVSKLYLSKKYRASIIEKARGMTLSSFVFPRSNGISLTSEEKRDATKALALLGLTFKE